MWVVVLLVVSYLMIHRGRLDDPVEEEKVDDVKQDWLDYVENLD